MTILSVNKTRDLLEGGRNTPTFLRNRWAHLRPFFVEQRRKFHEVIFMNKRTKHLTHGALIGALYVVLTYLQNLIIPDSATWAIQFRVSEALCVLALFTPAAIPGLTIGCLLFNISFAGALPLDFLVGSLATLLATAGMWLTRRITVKGYPLPAMLLPAVCNALLVGWELELYIGGGFWINALLVAIGEVAVLLSLGSLLYYAVRSRHLDQKIWN